MYIVYGPTCSGKSSIANELADKYNGEIISADSRQIYKLLDIGTNKDPSNHLTNLILPNTRYSVSEWQKSAYYLINQIQLSGKTPIICGGTGLYIDSLLYKREYGNGLDPFMRVQYTLITPTLTRDEVYERINNRVIQMFEEGFVKEVENLITEGYGNFKPLLSTGYKDIQDHIKGLTSLETCIQKVQQGYRNYAKRQYTWFRKYKDL